MSGAMEDHCLSFHQRLTQWEQNPTENVLIFLQNEASNIIPGKWRRKWSREQISRLVLDGKVKNFLFLFPHKKFDSVLTALLYVDICRFSESKPVSVYALDFALDAANKWGLDAIFRPEQIMRPTFSGGDMQIGRIIFPAVGHLILCSRNKAPTYYEIFAQIYNIPVCNAYKEYIDEYRASKIYSLFGEDLESFLLYHQVTSKLHSQEKKAILNLLSIIADRRRTT